MKPVLVTGASGFLGWHVARLVAESGLPVRAMTRGRNPVPELPDQFPNLSVVTADLTNPASLAAAVEGCSAVYHVAADYRLWSRHPRELYAAHGDGPRNLLQATRNAHVQPIVYTS